MKRIMIIFISLLIISSIPAANTCFAASAQKPDMLNDTAILQNIIGRLMIQDIQDAVNGYYSEYLDYPPQIEVYAQKSSTKVLDIAYDSDNNLYIVTIETHPYLGAHNTIGHDRITFEISGSAEIKVRKFEHVKSFEIVPWLKDSLIKRFPENTY